MALIDCDQLASAHARAALFDDEEARRRVEALRARVDQLETTLSQRLGALEDTVKGQGLLDLLRDVEQIKADIAKLRGQYEVLTYELEQALKRQRDLYLDLDSRLRKIETAPGAAAGGAPGGDTGIGGAGATTVPHVRPDDVAGEQRSDDATLEQC